MITAHDLADRLSATLQEHQPAWEIRKGDLTHPDRWPLRRRDEIDAYRADLLQITDAAEQLLAGGLDGRDRVLADAVVYGGRATADRLDTLVELTSINSAMAPSPSP